MNEALEVNVSKAIIKRIEEKANEISEEDYEI